MSIIHRLQQVIHRPIIRAVAIIGVVAIAGLLFLATIAAVTQKIINEPELGSIDQPAAAESDETASAGAAVRFGTHQPPALLYDSNRTGNYEIYRRSSAGSSVRLTSNNTYDSWWPKISPDGQTVLFYRTPKGVHDSDYTKTSLWTMDRNGDNQREIIANRAHGWNIHGHGEWSPDGSRIVMIAGTNGLLIVHTDPTGGDIRLISTLGQTQDLDPSWSPDGSRITYVYQGEVWTVPVVADGSQPVRLTNDSYTDYDPYYSPDGQYIAYLTQVTAAPAPGAWAIRMMRTDGTENRFVINDGKVNSKPEWSADGKYIYFHRNPAGAGDSGFFGLWFIKPDGSDLTAIPTGAGSNEYPDREP